MNVTQLGALIAVEAERPAAGMTSMITFVLLVVYATLGIRSFIVARREKAIWPDLRDRRTLEQCAPTTRISFPGFRPDAGREDEADDARLRVTSDDGASDLMEGLRYCSELSDNVPVFLASLSLQVTVAKRP